MFLMITTSKQPRYLVEFNNGAQSANADAPVVKGGNGAGFGPHELLEASLACCINMWIRMQADRLSIPVGEIVVNVTLKRDDPERATFFYTVSVSGQLTEEQREALLKAADDCPVKRTLLKELSFELQAS
jgi:putative redox protein